MSIRKRVLLQKKEQPSNGSPSVTDSNAPDQYGTRNVDEKTDAAYREWKKRPQRSSNPGGPVKPPSQLNN